LTLLTLSANRVRVKSVKAPSWLEHQGFAQSSGEEEAAWDTTDAA
jgi:hypothetical protein